MTSFNIRKLKIRIAHKERELRSASDNTHFRIWLQLKALKTALSIAVQNREDSRAA